MKLYYIFSQKTSLLFYQVCIKSFIIFYNSLDFLGRYIPELSLVICAFYPDEKTYPWAKLFYTILWSKITLYFSIYVIRNNNELIYKKGTLTNEKEIIHRSKWCFTIAVNTGPLPDEALRERGADLLFPSMQALATHWEEIHAAIAACAPTK